MVPYKPHHYHPEARMAGRPGLFAEVEPQPPAYSESNSRTLFASISLHQTDRILLLHFPPMDIAALRQTIKQNWRRGIQDERSDSERYEFKCHGNPWSGHGDEAIPSRILARSILACLYSIGWMLTASTGVFMTPVEKDTMIFRKQAVPPPASEWMSISFDQGDRLRLIGAPTDLLGSFRELLRSMEMLQEGAWKDKTVAAYEFKMHGYPWGWTHTDKSKFRPLVLRMLETLEAGGWSLYATVDHRHGGHSSDASTDSWYCVRALDWAPGGAVFHR